MNTKAFIIRLVQISIGILALIGLLTVSVFIAMRFGLLNVRGSIDARNQFFLNAHSQTSDSTSISPEENATMKALEYPCIDVSKTTCSWQETPEWSVIKPALVKDAPIIKQVEAETGVPSRLIAAVVVPEQARFFSSNREVFKRWFEPMKLLGSLSQFSLGVSGIKQETAARIEHYANDTTSPFYPGAEMASLVAYPEGANHDAELYNRLTDEHNHYYSYLYTALFIREINAQWERAGYDISNQAGIIVTLFNLGFDKSRPNPTPLSGGATLTIGNTNYTYGTLGNNFYMSNELLDVFPRK